MMMNVEDIPNLIEETVKFTLITLQEEGNF